MAATGLGAGGLGGRQAGRGLRGHALCEQRGGLARGVGRTRMIAREGATHEMKLAPAGPGHFLHLRCLWCGRLAAVVGGEVGR